MSLALAGSLLVSVPDLRAEVREWTRSSDGKKIAAEFVGLKDDNTVQIKLANGQTFEVPLASLSAEDGVYAKEAATKMAGATKPADSASPTGPKPAVPEGETTVTLSKVHVCCGDCVDAVAKIGLDAKNPIPAGVTIMANEKEESIIVKAPTGKDAQAALRAIVTAGFYGVSDNPAVMIADLKPDEFTTETMVLRGVHLCCNGCVRSFSKALESVEGVKSHEAKTGATAVKVSGEAFKPYEVLKALREAGFGASFQ